MAASGFAVPESNIREWLRSQTSASGGGSDGLQFSSGSIPPLAPATAPQCPVPLVQRNALLLERLRMSDDEILAALADVQAEKRAASQASSLAFREESLSTSSPHAKAAAKLDERSASSSPSPSAMRSTTPQEAYAPRRALEVAPTPVPALTPAPHLMSPEDVHAPGSTSRQLGYAYRTHSVGTMTAPHMGFSLADYISFEHRRQVHLEALQRALIDSEQDRIRVKEFEYPMFKRTAQFTVSKLEKLFLKQERALRLQKDETEMAHEEVRKLKEQHEAWSRFGVNPLRQPQYTPKPDRGTSLSPVVVQLSEDQEALAEQLKVLANEISEAVIPSLRELVVAPREREGLPHREELQALLSVTTLLSDELQSIRAAFMNPPKIPAAAPSTSPVAKPSLPPRGPSTSRRTPLEMQALVSSLIDQNQVLLSALQLAEQQGFTIPSDVLEQLRISPQQHF